MPVFSYLRIRIFIIRIAIYCIAIEAHSCVVRRVIEQILAFLADMFSVQMKIA